MTKTNIILSACIILFLLTSCGTIKDGFKSQRKNSTDEFLVEKKKPLIMPPNYEKLPVPVQKEDDNKNIQDLLIKNKTKKTPTSQTGTTSNKTEDFILKKIKNN